MIILDYSSPPAIVAAQPVTTPNTAQQEPATAQQDSVFTDEHHSTVSAENLFKLYISRLHQKEVRVFWIEITVLISGTG